MSTVASAVACVVARRVEFNVVLFDLAAVNQAPWLCCRAHLPCCDLAREASLAPGAQAKFDFCATGASPRTPRSGCDVSRAVQLGPQAKTAGEETLSMNEVTQILAAIDDLRRTSTAGGSV